MNKVYVGWDPKEFRAYNVAVSSILKRSSEPIKIIPLVLDDCGHLIKRPLEIKDGKTWCPISCAWQTTEFAISRFLIPFLTKGWAVFMDPDVVCLTDISELFKLADSKYAVMVVKHEHIVKDGEVKGMGIQTSYPRKNWSSVVLWNCDHEAHSRLTLEKINTWPGRDLHAFKWLKDEEIGGLPQGWNHLVGVYDVKIAHFTNGGPWIDGWVPKPTDKLWNEEAGI